MDGIANILSSMKMAVRLFSSPNPLRSSRMKILVYILVSRSKGRTMLILRMQTISPSKVIQITWLFYQEAYSFSSWEWMRIYLFAAVACIIQLISTILHRHILFICPHFCMLLSPNEISIFLCAQRKKKRKRIDWNNNRHRFMNTCVSRSMWVLNRCCCYCTPIVTLISFGVFVRFIEYITLCAAFCFFLLACNRKRCCNIFLYYVCSLCVRILLFSIC